MLSHSVTYIRVWRQLGRGQAGPQAVMLPSCSRHGGSMWLAEGSEQAVAAAAEDAGWHNCTGSSWPNDYLCKGWPQIGVISLAECPRSEHSASLVYFLHSLIVIYVLTVLHFTLWWRVDWCIYVPVKVILANDSHMHSLMRWVYILYMPCF